MELVKGLTITEFADKNRMPIEERLRLFIDVCRAVQHAHQKGVIHRDLKPTNVMVTLHDGRPVVKVIDFGVAKATSQQLTQRTLFTAYGQMVGTPAYMSPEQAEMSGLDIDTRTDIYSLGVLLYELLTGTTPLELDRLRAAGFAEMQRLIREEEAVRPSTRLSTLGAQATALATSRGTDAKRLGQFLRGDLDWIVMKSLEKDRNRRYETPSAFAADIERFLDHDAIAARPPSATYRLRKFLRRHAGVAAAVGAVAIVLLIGGVVSTIFGIQATRQAARAVDAEQAARQNLAEARQAGRSLASARDELRGTLYAAEMNLVQSAWDARQYDRALLLLDRQRPRPGEGDLRGWEWHYWRRLTARGRLRSLDVPELTRLVDHDWMIAASGFTGSAPLAFTNDGERLAAIVKPPADGTGVFDGPKVIMFDGATGRRLSEFELLTEPDMKEIPPPLSISDDGARFVHASKTREQWQTVIRDGHSGEILATLELLELESNPRTFLRVNFAISPDGSLVAEVQTAILNEASQGSAPRLFVERRVTVYDAATGELVTTLPPQPLSHARLLWSPDGKQLLLQGLRGPGAAHGEVRHDSVIRRPFGPGTLEPHRRVERQSRD
jgi:hypothetical protein